MTAREAILTLLSSRGQGKTICPSEAARLLAQRNGVAGDWRGLMPAIHDAAEALATRGDVAISWRGDARAVRDGPYRIGKHP